MAAVTGMQIPSLAWRRTLPVLIVALTFVLICFRETFTSMAEIWARSETFTHGFIVPPLSAWLIWRRRKVLASLPPITSPWAIVPILFAGVAWLLGDLASANSLTQLAATSILVLTVVAVIGLRVAREIAFPLGFLFFSVPLGEFFLPILMEWTANFTITALRLTGIPVYREGLSFVIPSGNWSVVEACSGVRYLIASLMVGTLFAYLNYRSNRRRLIFVAVSAIVPIFANWVRAYLIVMLGHLSGNRIAVGVDHLIYGWIFFGVVILSMFVIGARWSEVPAEDVPVPTLEGEAAFQTDGARWLVLLPLVSALGWPVWAANWIGQRDAAPPPRVLIDADKALAGWKPRPGLDFSLRPAYPNPSVKWSSGYEKLGIPVGVFIAYYRNQNHERKLISSNNAVVKSNDLSWVIAGRGSAESELDGHPVSLRTWLLASQPASTRAINERLLAWQWHWVDGHLTSSDTLASFYSVLALLTGNGDDAATIIVFTPETAQGGAESTLSAFVREAGPTIVDALRATKDVR